MTCVVPSFWEGSLVTLLFLFARCQERPLCLLLLPVSNSDHPRPPGPALLIILSLSLPLRLPMPAHSTASLPHGIFTLCHSNASIVSWFCPPSSHPAAHITFLGLSDLSPLRFTASPAPMLPEPVPHPAGSQHQPPRFLPSLQGIADMAAFPPHEFM